MTIRQRRYSKEELARRGKELYESQIRQQVETSNLGKIVAIDIETGTFEVADDTLVASDRLLERCPDAQTGLSALGTVAFIALVGIAVQPRRYSKEEFARRRNEIYATIFDVYRGLVIWDGEFWRIDINESETSPLIGMSLLFSAPLKVSGQN